ncbi:MAG: hypothetical protein RL508_68 [Actinomycetota bacterium]|jgi:hypothetical protein
MLLITDAGFVEILREPQFTQHFTVRAETEAALQPLLARTYCKQIRHDSDPTFCYSFYAYEDEVRTAFKIGFGSWSITELGQNISPPPLGYQSYCENEAADAWESRYVYHDPLRNFHLVELDEFAGDWPVFKYYPVYVHAHQIFEDSETEEEDSD